MRILIALVFMCLASAAAVAAGPGDYPARPVRIIVGFTPGSTSDVLARFIAQRLAEKWGRQVIVDNRDGAGGIIAAEIAANSAPDGYTLALNSNAFVMAPYLRARVSYDAFRDFVPLAQVAQVPNVFLVSKSLGITSIKDLIAQAKANPGKLRYASSGKGTPSQLVVELFKFMAGVDMEEIAYKSSAQALTDTFSGEVALNAPGLGLGLPHVKSGRALGLAVTGSKRTPLAPEIPTLAEAGVPNYEAYGWYGIFAPAKIPADLRTYLEKEINGILAEPEMRDRFERAGAEVVISTPQQFDAFLKAEADKWGKLFKRLGVKPDQN